jgi:hypothetical protein
VLCLAGCLLAIHSAVPSDEGTLAPGEFPEASRLLSIQPFKRLRSGRFTILTDVSDDHTVRAIAGNLEATYDLLDSVFALGKSAKTDGSPLFTVYVYRSKDQLSSLAATLGVENADGIYNPPLRLLAFHTQLHSNQTLARVMLHEATHAYLDQYIEQPTMTELPRWFDEGFAEYVASSDIRRGRLVLGSFPRKQRYRDASVSINIKSDPLLSVQTLKKRALLRGRTDVGPLPEAWRPGSCDAALPAAARRPA